MFDCYQAKLDCYLAKLDCYSAMFDCYLAMFETFELAMFELAMFEMARQVTWLDDVISCRVSSKIKATGSKST